jgi:hypothetical protein
MVDGDLELGTRTRTEHSQVADSGAPAVVQGLAAAALVADVEKKYPGVELAYELAVASYDSIIKRLDVMDGRLQTMLAFAATTTAVVPSVANSRGLTFRSYWLYAALTVFFVQLIVGTIPRFWGRIKLIKPEVLWQRWLHKSTWQFKKDYIYFASEDFNHNAELLKSRWWLTVAVSILFFVEVLLLLIWVALAQIPKQG